MFQFFANIFGYVLNFIYQIVNNYGIAMILFTLMTKLLMMPLSIKQQKAMKKNAKLQEKMQVLQFKYKNNPEQLNQEMMKLYKEENVSPFSGCLIAILQFILLFSIFYMVRCPLTYMRKVNVDEINTSIQQLKENEKIVSAAYPEIDLIREVEFLKEKNPEKESLKQYEINMEFLGLDLSKIPQQHLDDWTVYIIPILYILSTFISTKITTTMQNKKSKGKIIDIAKDEENTDKEENAMVPKEEEEFDAMAQTNKMMSWMIPIMSVSISIVAPLGLALYWLVSNITMILERVILNKIIKED